ncbi:glycosyltransferase family 9 protein [Oleiagrimonas sp. MCCC 1A03011]|uniref:glycosyltransferase family 9 protein n=1 Tax=Oleiagrimonas sp. MCCC 1A03011 TaxID=1926883 RepID=UPI000DC3624E|nr:glycosyltransferase family 9 protein [Oleiagrimonas sp. MCCC 1A03011]RAP57625.1 ADP-heptose--LPS heptosyltransferase [Oleiagrimonas sp. MCCC 1A03011]
MTDRDAIRHLCLLRTSAIGDVTHVVPLVHRLRAHFPGASLTWIIGKLEHRLVGDLSGVEFVVFDKARGWAGMRAVRKALGGRRFDALLHMQVALRSNLLSTLVQADRRIGYDRARSRDLHGLFVHERIPARRGEHALDAIGSFAEPLGVPRGSVQWDIPVPEEAREWAREQIPITAPTLVVSPSSSHPLRNWRAERYAAVIDHAAARGLRVLLTGGPSAAERAMADAILAACRSQPVDLTGRDTLKRALALFSRADMVLTPDSGPMHMANAVGTPVIGLHAASNPARSGPYSDRRWCVDRYDDAARHFLHKSARELRWGTKIERPGVMDLIGVTDVIERMEALMKHLGIGR